MSEYTAKSYSNPRTEAVIPDWPLGFRLRTTATFTVERHPKKGERALRTTVDPRTGRVSKPAALTYASKVRIVDGDDGRTYVVSLSRAYRMVTVMRGDMKYHHESVGAEDPRYAEMVALFADAAQAAAQ